MSNIKQCAVTHIYTHLGARTHRNCTWGTTAGNRHRTELSCHGYTTELTHTHTRAKYCQNFIHTHTDIHTLTNDVLILTYTHTDRESSLDPHEMRGSLLLFFFFFHVRSLHQRSVLQDSFWILICDRWRKNFLNPTDLELPLNEKETQPRPWIFQRNVCTDLKVKRKHNTKKA